MLDWLYTWLPWELLPCRYAGPVSIAFGILFALFGSARWFGIALIVLGLVLMAFNAWRDTPD